MQHRRWDVTSTKCGSETNAASHHHIGDRTHQKDGDESWDGWGQQTDEDTSPLHRGAYLVKNHKGDSLKLSNAQIENNTRGRDIVKHWWLQRFTLRVGLSLWRHASKQLSHASTNPGRNNKSIRLCCHYPVVCNFPCSSLFTLTLLLTLCFRCADVCI